MEAKQFHNFSNEDFTWKFDGIEYTFKAGQTMFLEDFKVVHFTKHLVDREMNRAKLPTNHQTRTTFEAKCVPSDEVVTPREALDINEKAKVVVKAKKAEVEFAGLSEKENKK